MSQEEDKLKKQYFARAQSAQGVIRDAALKQFAEHGFKGATVRSIAHEAGVSVGLLQHHFPTKQALREACDEAVLDVFQQQLMQSVDDNALTNPDVMAALYTASTPLIRYLARAMVDGSPAAAHVFAEMTATTEAFLSTRWPERFPPDSPKAHDRAAVMTAMHLGTIVLHEHLAAQFGVDPLEREHSPQIGLAIFDIYSAMGEYTTSAFGDQVREAVIRQQGADDVPDKEHENDD